MKPTFWVRDVPIYGDLILAPMANFSDHPYRLICREYGSAMSYTEFVSVAGILHHSERASLMLAYRPAERPVLFQIVGSDPDRILQAAQQIERLGPDIIDLNMGCSVRKIVGRGEGAAWLKDPVQIGRIFARLSRALSVPVTGKIRLGWDNRSLNYLDVVRAMAEHGAAMVAVHGRTRTQSYDDPANWEAIAQIKQAVDIPVIGNGDIFTVADIERMKQQTGCDGVMIGRAALGNPWIFQRRDIAGVSLAERVAMISRHLELMLDFYGRKQGLLFFRKHTVKYLHALPYAARLRARLMTCSDPDQFIRLIEAWQQEITSLEET